MEIGGAVQDKYIQVMLSYPRNAEERVECLLSLTDYLGSEIYDAEELQRTLAEAPEWELADAQELLTAAFIELGQEERSDCCSASSFIYQRLYFEDSPRGWAACRAFLATCEAPDMVAVGLCVSEPQTLDNAGWETAWQVFYHPFQIGNILVTPAWENPETASETVIRIWPGMAFGTGTHASTALLLELLQQVDCRKKRVLDVGCGSGILAIAAKKRGAAQVEAMDIDTDALASCRENVRLNAVDVQLSTSDLLEKADGVYDIIFANLLKPLILRMLPDVGAHLASDGALLLSGLLAKEEAEICRALGRYDLRAVRVTKQGEWAAFLVKRKEATA